MLESYLRVVGYNNNIKSSRPSLPESKQRIQALTKSVKHFPSTCRAYSIKNTGLGVLACILK